MNETAQIVVVSVVTVLTVILSIVGLQIVFILKEIRTTLVKVNGMLDDARNVTAKISHSTDSVSGMLVGIKTALSLIGSLKKGKDHEE
ncbi:hypothetical protein HY468_05430 [Candidatus Roizmanbacteria bacterium]|nr:hypothetical protein [Candidatus Roizmanbacteria bacterium]